MKTLLLALCLATLFISPLFAQAPAGLSMPTKAELESAVSGTDLSMGDKLSLRGILQGMREQGEKVLADDKLSDAQKVSQVTKIRQTALDQTGKILPAPQQQKLAALLLPKS